MTINMPKRKVIFNIEGKKFEAKELSAHYLMEAQLNPDTDTADAAILDSMGEIGDEDLKLFGIDTKEILYTEIVKFTFKEKLSLDQRTELGEKMKLSESEVALLSQDAQVQLKNIIASREKGKTDGGKDLLE